MKGDLFIRCPECDKRINLSAQLRDFRETCDEPVIPSEFYLSIICPHCDEGTIGMEVFETPEQEEIYSPALKEKVIFKKPKIKSITRSK